MQKFGWFGGLAVTQGRQEHSIQHSSPAPWRT